VLTRALTALLVCWAAGALAGEAGECTAGIRVVRDALAADQNIADEGRRAVEQLLRDAIQARNAGDEVVCKEMIEDAKELLGLDAAD
jgi:hypothetical protein